MRILFLSKQNSCRSQMAEAILGHLDKNDKLEIFSAGISPSDHISPVVIEVLKDIGITLSPSVPKHYSQFIKTNFDYLITVGDGTKEDFEIPDLYYDHKIHLGFKNPYKQFKNRDELHSRCVELRDEIYTELEYFYRQLLKKEMQPE